jgi:type VI secretion system protein ImpH
VGGLGPVDRERIRFRPALDLGFPSSDIQTLSERPEGGYILEGTFLGLYGIASPLPSYFTENLLHADDPTVERGFYDIFHHRLYALFHRCWERMHMELGYRADGDDAFSRRAMGLVGLRTEALGTERQTSPGRLMGLAGSLAGQTRSQAQFEAAIRTWFPDVPITIEPCVGTWVMVPPDQRNRLGAANCSLGGDCTLGGEVFDRASTFGVTIGPVPLATYLRFLPSGDLMAELREIIELFNTDSLDYRVDLLIQPGDLPRLTLEGLFSTDQTRLGWSTWIGDPPSQPEPVSFIVSTWVDHG